MYDPNAVRTEPKYVNEQDPRNYGTKYGTESPSTYSAKLAGIGTQLYHALTGQKPSDEVAARINAGIDVLVSLDEMGNSNLAEAVAYIFAQSVGQQLQSEYGFKENPLMELLHRYETIREKRNEDRKRVTTFKLEKS